MRARAAGLLTAAALPLALLAGCAAAPEAPGPAPSRPVPTAPAPSWPAVPGRVLTATTTPGERLVRIAVPDAEAAYARARDLLVDAGYVLTKDRAGTGGGDGQACRPSTLVCVGFTATDDPEHGPSVLYEVFRSTGVTG